MLFVSFTTAYVVRKAGATWDPARNDFSSNWVPLSLPLQTPAAEYRHPSLEQHHAGGRAASRRPGCCAGANRRHSRHPRQRQPLAAVVMDDRSCWVRAFLAGQVYAWRLLERANPHASPPIPAARFFFILTGVHAVHLLGGLIALLYAGVTNLAAQAAGDTSHHPRRDRVVLALHGPAVAVHLRAAVLREIELFTIRRGTETALKAEDMFARSMAITPSFLRDCHPERSRGICCSLAPETTQADASGLSLRLSTQLHSERRMSASSFVRSCTVSLACQATRSR